MFELNDELKIEKELFLGSIIYTIDNFYKNPLEVHDYLFSNPPSLWKINERPSCNGLYFEDRRLIKTDERLKIVIDFLGNLVSQKPSSYNIVTNQVRFNKHQFNDIDNCHWWPHTDHGYNGIVYFNEDSVNGTNIYYQINKQDMITEHHRPWRLKSDFEVLKHLEPRYNRLIFFDGHKFPHGMNIENKKYFSEEYRKNQVFFFENV
tara:strand:+ start:57 stop:674 length:618 start_codon:yes stop_codon:yes gene_type:complete